MNTAVINWLLEGDVAIQYQTYRDLLGTERPDLQKRIALEGWGKAFLDRRTASGHWGRSFYQPKWTSSHYTLLDLKHLGMASDISSIQDSIGLILRTSKDLDGGINPHTGGKIRSDVCVNGMFLNYASHFRAPESDLQSIVDFVLSQRVADGGFNCQSNRGTCVHSSLHTTLSVLEGFQEYSANGYRYRLPEIQDVVKTSHAFILMHKLYQSDKTGKTIDPKMLMLSYPSRWRYDILRCLDYFWQAGIAWDERIKDAVAIILKKRDQNGLWPLQARHPGQTHFEMEIPGKPSRWNTLRALRVLRKYGESFSTSKY